MRYITEQDFRYAVDCRRYLHRHPETGFDLDNTVAFVRGELDKLGIVRSEAGPASVIAYIGPMGAAADTVTVETSAVFVMGIA